MFVILKHGKRLNERVRLAMCGATRGGLRHGNHLNERVRLAMWCGATRGAGARPASSCGAVWWGATVQGSTNGGTGASGARAMTCARCTSSSGTRAAAAQRFGSRCTSCPPRAWSARSAVTLTPTLTPTPAGRCLCAHL